TRPAGSTWTAFSSAFLASSRITVPGGQSAIRWWIAKAWFRYCNISAPATSIMMHLPRLVLHCQMYLGTIGVCNAFIRLLSVLQQESRCSGWVMLAELANFRWHVFSRGYKCEDRTLAKGQQARLLVPRWWNDDADGSDDESRIDPMAGDLKER